MKLYLIGLVFHPILGIDLEPFDNESEADYLAEDWCYVQADTLEEAQLLYSFTKEKIRQRGGYRGPLRLTAEETSVMNRFPVPDEPLFLENSLKFPSAQSVKAC